MYWKGLKSIEKIMKKCYWTFFTEFNTAETLRGVVMFCQRVVMLSHSAAVLYRKAYDYFINELANVKGISSRVWKRWTTVSSALRLFGPRIPLIVQNIVAAVTTSASLFRQPIFLILEVFDTQEFVDRVSMFLISSAVNSSNVTALLSYSMK